MNITNFIFQLFHIHNHLAFSLLTPLRSPCTPFVDCENTSGDYIDFLVDYSHNFNECVNTHDDQTNTIVDSSDTLDIYVVFAS
jgi:hypothetical protein